MPVVFRLHQSRSMRPLIRNCTNYAAVYRRVIHQGDEQGAGGRANLFKTAGNRYRHFTLRLGIDGEGQVEILQVLSQFVCAMTENDGDFTDAGVAQVFEAGLDDRTVAERE